MPTTTTSTSITTADTPSESWESSVVPDLTSDDAPLIDLTESLPLHSKRTKRLEKKQQQKKARRQPKLLDARGLLDLPYELQMMILELLRPSDLFVLLRVCKPLRDFILANEQQLMRQVLNLRYPVLQQCLLRPVLLRDVSLDLQPLLLRAAHRPDLQHSHRPLHQHIPRPDPTTGCTCLTCIGRWNALCAVVDFSHWQTHLDNGQPIPQIPRGSSPPWNGRLLARHADIVTTCLSRPLWYARVLEAHLDSTTRSVRRHSANKADKRAHFLLTDEDVRAGTDAFLQRAGPSEVVYPYARDYYYMLEAFVPGRAWIGEREEWAYASNGDAWHEYDLGVLAKLVAPGEQDKQVPTTQVPAPPNNDQLLGDEKVLEGEEAEQGAAEAPSMPAVSA